MLYRAHIFITMSMALVLISIALMAPDFIRDVPHGDDPRSSMMFSAVVLMMASVSGIMANRSTRLNCQQFRKDIACITQTGELTPIQSPDRSLKPLVQAINIYTNFTQQRLADAKRRAKEAEIQLKVVTLEREHAQSIIRSISDAVLVTDPWDELVMANESASRALGFQIPSEGRKPIDGLLNDSKVIGLIREMRQSKSTGGRRIVEHKVPSSTGDRTYKITLSCLGGNRPEGAGVVAVMHDMTHEAEVSRMKNEFVSHVSHELRTPLASIKAYVEMLIDGEATDQHQTTEFYEVIQNEANRLGRLIDNILDISRIESGVVKVTKSPLSLTVLVKEAVEIINPQALTKQITISESSLPTMYQVMADKDMMYRAILNLLSNSVKYTPEGGSVSVTMAVDETLRKITLRITDTGIGIPVKDLPFVFDKFYRVEANNKMAKGTGLGLSLVKQIVENVHHGRVFVESTVGKGSCFGIELDLC